MSKGRVLGSMLVIGTALLGAATVFADRVSRQAEITALSGEVEWLKGGAGDWMAASLNHKLESGDKIRTGPGSEATLTLDDGSVLQLSPDAEFAIQSLSRDSNTQQLESLLAILKGKVRAQVTPLTEGSSFEIETPAMVAAVRGTTLNLGINPDGTISASSEEDIVDLVREGENSFTAVLETGEEVLIEYNPDTGEIKITCVKGPVDVTGPDGVTRTMNREDVLVFSGGAATFIPVVTPTTDDAPIANSISEAQDAV